MRADSWSAICCATPSSPPFFQILCDPGSAEAMTADLSDAPDLLLKIAKAFRKDPDDMKALLADNREAEPQQKS